MSERSELTTSKGPTLPETDRARRVLTLRDVEAPFPLADSERDAYLRRVSTLFADDSRCRCGGLGRVLHATNALGEQFAVKLLILPSESAREASLFSAGSRASTHTGTWTVFPPSSWSGSRA